MSSGVAICPQISDTDRTVAEELGVEWLACSGCGREFPVARVSTCSFCSTGLEPVYDLGAIRARVSGRSIEEGPPSLWRFGDLLPVPVSGLPDIPVGHTPLRGDRKLAAENRLSRVWIKDESANLTGRSSDRGVAVALAAAVRLGVESLYGASPDAGSAVTELAPAFRLDAGRPDRESRRRSFVVDEDLRVYYLEGFKTLAFEIAEQLRWRVPDAIVLPGSPPGLIGKVTRGLEELIGIGLLDDRPLPLVIEAWEEDADPTAVLRSALTEGRIAPNSEVVVVTQAPAASCHRANVEGDKRAGRTAVTSERKEEAAV